MFLTDLAVGINNICYNNCIYCSSMSKRNDFTKIDIIKLKELAYFAKQNNIEEFNISGGEPLLHENILELLSYCCEIELNTRVYTAGNYNVDFLKYFIYSLNLINNSKKYIKFIFNYDSHKKENMSILKGVNLREVNKINNNLKSLLLNKYVVEVHICLNKTNIKDIYNTCKYLKSINVSKVNFLNLILQGNALNEENINKLKLNLEDYNGFDNNITLIKEDLISNDFKIKVNINSSIYNERHKCKACINKLVVRCDGKVFPCEAFKSIENSNSYILGNIYNNTIEEIYKKAVEFRINNYISCNS
jgi:radical SAM protein with 4Fe4S-binding SPASM domain